MSSDPIPPASPEPEPAVPLQTLPPVITTPVGANLGPQTSTTGLAPNVAAGLSVFTFGIGGIVFLLLEKRDQFVRFWAMQSIFFGGAVVALSIAVPIVLVILGHIIWIFVGIFWFLYGVIRLCILALWIFMLFKAFGGKEWEIPILGRMARQQLARTPLV